jgi:hypothetical protein
MNHRVKVLTPRKDVSDLFLNEFNSGRSGLTATMLTLIMKRPSKKEWLECAKQANTHKHIIRYVDRHGFCGFPPRFYHVINRIVDGIGDRHLSYRDIKYIILHEQMHHKLKRILHNG